MRLDLHAGLPRLVRGPAAVSCPASAPTLACTCGDGLGSAGPGLTPVWRGAAAQGDGVPDEWLAVPSQHQGDNAHRCSRRLRGRQGRRHCPDRPRFAACAGSWDSQTRAARDLYVSGSAHVGRDTPGANFSLQVRGTASVCPLSRACHTLFVRWLSQGSRSRWQLTLWYVVQVTGALSASSAHFGSGEVVAAALNSHGSLNIMSGDNQDVSVAPGRGAKVRVYSDLWMGRGSVLSVGDHISVNGTGTIIAGRLEIDAATSTMRSVSGNVTLSAAESVLVRQNGGGASELVLLGSRARLALEGASERFSLESTDSGQFKLGGTNPISAQAETILSIDHITFSDFLYSNPTWTSRFTGTVAALHVSSGSGVFGSLSMNASKLWSHNPHENISVISAASVLIGSSAGDADIRLQPEGAGRVIVDATLELNGSRVSAVDTTAGLQLLSAGSLLLKSGRDSSITSQQDMYVSAAGRASIRAASMLQIDASELRLQAYRNINVTRSDFSVAVDSVASIRSANGIMLKAVEAAEIVTYGIASVQSNATLLSSSGSLSVKSPIMDVQLGVCSDGSNATTQAACEMTGHTYTAAVDRANASCSDGTTGGSLAACTLANGTYTAARLAVNSSCSDGTTGGTLEECTRTNATFQAGQFLLNTTSFSATANTVALSVGHLSSVGNRFSVAAREMNLSATAVSFSSDNINLDGNVTGIKSRKLLLQGQQLAINQSGDASIFVGGDLSLHTGAIDIGSASAINISASTVRTAAKRFDIIADQSVGVRVPEVSVNGTTIQLMAESSYSVSAGTILARIWNSMRRGD
jgi:hypothetical protein